MAAAGRFQRCPPPAAACRCRQGLPTSTVLVLDLGRTVRAQVPVPAPPGSVLWPGPGWRRPPKFTVPEPIILLFVCLTLILCPWFARSLGPLLPEVLVQQDGPAGPGPGLMAHKPKLSDDRPRPLDFGNPDSDFPYYARSSHSPPIGGRACHRQPLPPTPPTPHPSLGNKPHVVVSHTRQSGVWLLLQSKFFPSPHHPHPTGPGCRPMFA